MTPYDRWKTQTPDYLEDEDDGQDDAGSDS
jgi:hypothetical protein